MASVLPDYDTAYFYVAPEIVNNAVTVIAGTDPTNPTGLLGDVLTQLANVISTLENLQLSWVGDAADAAQDFTDQWNTASANLFGTDADPQSGVFPRLLTALNTAVGNYDGAEQNVVNLFAGFSVLSASGTASGTDQSVVNTGSTVTTAITETFGT